MIRHTGMGCERPDWWQGIVPDVKALDIFVDFWEVRHQLGIPKTSSLRVLVDLDGTVLGEEEQHISPLVREHFQEQRTSGAITELHIASNSTNEATHRYGKQLADDCQVFLPPKRGGRTYRKPHPQYFAQTRMDGCDEMPTLMIGDKGLRDVLGAHRAGFFSMLVSPRGRRQPLADRLLLRPADRLALWLGSCMMLGNGLVEHYFQRERK